MRQRGGAMKVFDRYARFYDVLYRDKNYPLEAEYIDKLIKKYGSGPARTLDMGCGTGGHALALAARGYEIAAVDRSAPMLECASRKLDDAAGAGLKIDFINADIENLSLGVKFGAVVSLFHVVSYMISDDDVKAAFAAAGRHLDAGGLFIFDCWYGPAVLNLRPEKRTKSVETKEFYIVRHAAPEFVPGANIVGVNYRFVVKNKAGGAVEEFTETHRLRYFFSAEIESLLDGAGFSMIESSEWLTAKTAGNDTWGVCFVARKSNRK